MLLLLDASLVCVDVVIDVDSIQAANYIEIIALSESTRDTVRLILTANRSNRSCFLGTIADFGGGFGTAV